MRIYLTVSFLIFVLRPALHAQDLAFYIGQAKINSPLIQDHKNQSEASRLEAERLRAFYTKAQVSLTGSYLIAPIINRGSDRSALDLNPSEASDYSGYDLATTNGGAYQGLLNINQPLFNDSKYRTAEQQTLISAQINENTILLTGHDLEKLITDQYILCLQDYKQAENLSKLSEIIREQKNIISKLVENGIARQSDLSLLIIEQKAQENALNSSRASYRRDLMDLRVLCGISDTTFQVLDDISLQREQDVVVSRFVDKYRLDSLNLVAAQKVFELRYKPVVGAFANAGLNAVYAPTIAHRFGFSAGVNFAMNIADGRQRRITQQRTSVLLRSTSLYKNFFYNQNSVRKSRILAELKSIDERLSLTEEQLQEYRKLLELYKQELSHGQISVINYLNILKSLTNTQRDFVLLQTNKALLINLYNYWNW